MRIVGVGAALLVLVLTDGGRLAAQATAPPQAPIPPPPSSGGAVQWPAGWPDLEAKTPRRRSVVVIAVPPATDTLGMSEHWSFGLESPAPCTVCPGHTGVGTLWHTSGLLAWQVDAGAIGVRVTGQRGARLPLFMTAPGSGNFIPQASDMILSDARTHWVVTLSAERRVLASHGRTLSLFGDLFLPLGSMGRVPTIQDVRTPPQRAFVGGVRLRSRTPLPAPIP